MSFRYVYEESRMQIKTFFNDKDLFYFNYAQRWYKY